MSNSAEIKRVLKSIAHDNGKGDNRNLFFTAEVKKVGDETCDVEVGGFEITGVHLAAASDGNKGNLIIKPKKGSVVLICDKTGGDMTWLNVVAFSEIASVTMKVDEIIINEGENDGLIIIQKLTDKINELVDWCENHTHTLTPADGVTAAFSPSPLPVSGSIPKPSNPPSRLNKSDFENEKIKH